MSSIDDVCRVVRREAGRKQRVAANCSALGFALDAAQTSAMSSQELAIHALERLGLKIAPDSDAPAALDFYIAGLQHRGGAPRSWAQDSTGESYVDRYMQEER